MCPAGSPAAGYRVAVTATGWIRRAYVQVLLALVLGLAYGILAGGAGLHGFTRDWIAPFGVLFIDLLELIAVPLVFSTLVVGVASLADLRRLSRIGLKSLAIFGFTTAVACGVGLAAVIALGPGEGTSASLRQALGSAYEGEIKSGAEELREETGPLEPLLEMVPENVVAAASDNRNLLQLVIVALLIGIALVQIPRERSAPLVDLLDGVAHVVVRLVEMVMVIAPVGVFALIADAVVSMGAGGAGMLDLFGALGGYAATLVLALAIHTLVFYPALLRAFTRMPVGMFFRGLVPAQIVAFSTSSSTAALPVTMEQCREELDVAEEVNAFVVPLGATVHMNGTAIFLCVAAVFLAQAVGRGLTPGEYGTVAVLATLGSIGAVGIPSIGFVFLLVILETLAVPTGGIALLLGIDRLLDMLRTTTNVTGDAVAAVWIDAGERASRPAGQDPP